MACLTTGFQVVSRYPALALPPLILDLFIWLGPYLSPAPALQQIYQWFTAGDPESIAILQTPFNNLIESWKNFLLLLNPAPLLGISSLPKSFFSPESPFGPRLALSINTWYEFIPLAIILPLVGIALNAIYLQAIGRRTVEFMESPLPAPAPLTVLWIQLVMLGLALLPLIVAILIVLGIFINMGIMDNQWGQLLGALIVSIPVYIVFHLVLAIPALVLLKRPLIKAVQESIILTQMDFFGSMFLFLACLLISQGLNYVWMLPEASDWTFLIGIIGHSLMVTALTAALFIFYQERLAYLKTLQQTRSPRTAHVVD